MPRIDWIKAVRSYPEGEPPTDNPTRFAICYLGANPEQYALLDKSTWPWTTYRCPSVADCMTKADEIVAVEKAKATTPAPDAHAPDPAVLMGDDGNPHGD